MKERHHIANNQKRSANESQWKSNNKPTGKKRQATANGIAEEREEAEKERERKKGGRENENNRNENEEEISCKRAPKSSQIWKQEDLKRTPFTLDLTSFPPTRPMMELTPYPHP